MPSCSRIDYCNAVLAGVHDVHLRQLQRVLNAAARLIARKPHCGTLCTGYRSGNVWSLSCRCWCLIVCTTWHSAICVPCANRSLITLVVVTYARQHVVILLFQPQGRSDRSSQLRHGRTVHLELSSSTEHSCHLTSAFRHDLKTELFARAYH